MHDVTDVPARSAWHEPGGLQRMVAVSVRGARRLARGVLLLAPGGWWPHTSDEPTTVMTITLGGGGERTAERRHDGDGRPAGAGGAAARGAPSAGSGAAAGGEGARDDACRGADAKPVKAATAPTVEQAPDEARGRTPTKGPRRRAGSAVAETGARGQGFGLSTGGGAGSGSYLDVGQLLLPRLSGRR